MCDHRKQETRAHVDAICVFIAARDLFVIRDLR
jgi:hypothetical protein